jgi:hypothetical protein
MEKIKEGEGDFRGFLSKTLAKWRNFSIEGRICPPIPPSGYAPGAVSSENPSRWSVYSISNHPGLIPIHENRHNRRRIREDKYNISIGVLLTPNHKKVFSNFLCSVTTIFMLYIFFFLTEAFCPGIFFSS